MYVKKQSSNTYMGNSEKRKQFSLYLCNCSENLTNLKSRHLPVLISLDKGYSICTDALQIIPFLMVPIEVSENTCMLMVYEPTVFS